MYSRIGIRDRIERIVCISLSIYCIFEFTSMDLAKNLDHKCPNQDLDDPNRPNAYRSGPDPICSHRPT